MDCPITCECRRSPAGVFVLAACAWAAVFAPVMLGADFGAMLAGVFGAHVVALPLAAWALVAGAGLWLTLSGIAPAIEEGDKAGPWPLSLAAIGGGAVALACSWHLPAAWGPFWPLASEGIYVSAIAAGAANVGLSLAARGYEAGYTAGMLASGHGFTAAPSFDPGPWQEVIEGQAAKIEALTAECGRLEHEIARVGPPARDLQEVLLFPGVRKAVLKALHRDSHPGLADNEARAFDLRFQKASAVFQRIAR